MRNLLLFLLLACAACNSSKRLSNSTVNKILSDSSARVNSLEGTSDREWVYYINSSGKKILLKRMDNPPTAAPRTMIMDSVGDAPTGLAARVGADDPFTGSVRAIPKTTYVDKNHKKYRTIPALYRKLESNDYMKGLGIGHSNERVEEENRNVNIEKAYLYTITLEG